VGTLPQVLLELSTTTLAGNRRQASMLELSVDALAGVPTAGENPLPTATSTDNTLPTTDDLFIILYIPPIN